MTTLRYFLLVCLISLPTSLSAQTADDYVNVNFRAFSWERVSDNILYYRDGGKEVRLRLPWMKRSQSLHYAGPPEIVFYRKQSNADGGQMRIPVAKVTLVPGAQKNPLFLFFPRKSGGSSEEFGVRVFDDEQGGFPFGAYRVVNFTGAKVRGHIGRDVFELKPGETATVKPKQLISNDRNVEVLIQSPVNGKLKTVSESVWTHHKEGRVLCFLLESDNKARDFFDIKVVSEFASDVPLEQVEVRTMDDDS